MVNFNLIVSLSVDLSRLTETIKKTSGKAIKFLMALLDRWLFLLHP